jgi:hypothetical protein
MYATAFKLSTEKQLMPTESERYPDIIIAGVAKAGTTSLSRYLNSHPEIFIPEKEPNYFAFADGKNPFRVLDKQPILSRAQYLEYFSASKKPLIGEKSISYSYLPWTDHVISNIRKIHPHPEDLKIIIILRQPVERMFSQYLFNLESHENLPFEEAVAAWGSRKAQGWVPAYDYLGASYYARMVQKYLNAFREVKIVLFDELKNHPARLLEELTGFIGASSLDFANSQRSYNAGGVPGNPLVKSVFRFIRNENVKRWTHAMLPHRIRRDFSEALKKRFFKKPQLDAALFNELNKNFTHDISKLESIISRDLSHWKSIRE